MKSLRHPFACLALTGLLAACQAPPHHPPPAPPIRSQAPPAAPAPETAAASPAATGTDGEYAAPSPYAADVEFEEVPVDAAGRAAPPPTAAAPSDADQRDGTGGGGAQMPLARMNDDIAARERARTAGAVPGAATGLVGPRLELGSDTNPSTPGGSLEGARDGRGQASTRPTRAGTGGAAASGSGLGATPDRSGDGSQAELRPAADGAPPDFSTAADDDIVARQLREAAEGERDPELAARLWDEYRRYKAGL